MAAVAFGDDRLATVLRRFDRCSWMGADSGGPFSFFFFLPLLLGRAGVSTLCQLESLHCTPWGVCPGYTSSQTTVQRVLLMLCSGHPRTYTKDAFRGPYEGTPLRHHVACSEDPNTLVAIPVWRGGLSVTKELVNMNPWRYTSSSTRRSVRRLLPTQGSA